MQAQKTVLEQLEDSGLGCLPPPSGPVTTVEAPLAAQGPHLRNGSMRAPAPWGRIASIPPIPSKMSVMPTPYVLNVGKHKIQERFLTQSEKVWGFKEKRPLAIMKGFCSECLRSGGLWPTGAVYVRADTQIPRQGTLSWGAGLLPDQKNGVRVPSKSIYEIPSGKKVRANI